ncbi:hypothetical protein HPB49_021385 [Dermacentor silvarum]|uniref:Uncharacterized protein n=1 Tax=Dermacentor silvarum TaxID=543639 RepID=A0ACB8DRC1_DERSI|nr:hypothetical protein HPB49_021385 [Dermacentor silvarum]
MSFSSAISGPGNFPFNMKPSLPVLFALHTLKQKPNEGERRCDVARNAREAAASKPYVNVIVREKPESKALTESNVEDTVKQLRKFLQENGPSQEDDVLKALSPSKAQQIIEVYCTLTAFLDWQPRFLVLHEHLCSFIYYQQPDDQDDEWDCSSLVHGGASTGSCSASTNASGRQYAVARDGKSRSVRASSPSSSYHVPIMDGDDIEHEKRRMKNGRTLVHSLHRCESRALQAVLQTYDAEAQTHGWDPARFTELQSKPIKCDAEIAELKEGLITLQESHVLEAEQLRVKIEKLRKETTQAPPRNATELTNNRPATNEQMRTGTNGVRAQVIPQPPRPPLRQRSPPPRPKSQEAIRSKLHPRLSKTKPVSSERNKSSYVKGQSSKIVQQQRNYTDHDIRARGDQLRQSQGGFSHMTLNAFAALMVGRLNVELFLRV